MKSPVIDALKKLVQEDSVSFHFPGHKGRTTNIDWKNLMPMMDTTETIGMDNLLDPKGIINESQEEAAKVLNTKYTIYSVNGSTGSNYVALSSVTKKKDKILIQRNSHKSVYNSMILNDLTPVYFYPHYNKKYDISTGVDPKEIEKILDEQQDIKVVLLTNPNYYGICSDIKTIADIVHKRNKVLIVDEAHGPHLIYTKKYPKSAIELGADLVIHSTHKTLPSLTQTSLLHVCTDRIDINRVRDRFQLYTTTSPSYLFTASNESAIKYMNEEGGKKLDDMHEYLEELISRMNELKGVTVFTGDKDDKTIFDLDITRILISLKGYKGVEMKKTLYEDYNIRMEMCDYYYVLAMSTVMNTKDDFEKLYYALKDLSEKNDRPEIPEMCIDMPKPKIVMSPSEAYFSDKKLVDLDDSVGRIVAAPIIPYPPGVPLLATGEEMTKETYDYLKFLLENDINVVNLIENNKKLVVVE